MKKTTKNIIIFVLITCVLFSSISLVVIGSNNVFNLFNKASPENVSGSYIKTLNGQNGATAENKYYYYSHLIPVEQGKTYTTLCFPSFFGESQAKCIPGYNTAGEWVASIKGTINDTNKLTVTITNANVSFIRVNVNYLHLEEFMFVEGDTYPTEYIVYQEPSVTEDEVIADENPLYGKTVVFAGDSICSGNSAKDGLSGWAGRIGEKNEMVWKNEAIAGMTITSGIKNTCICDTDFGDDPDYIILEGGVNDADCIGLALDATPEKFGSYSPHDYTGPFDKTTFCGAVESLFQRVTTDYAGAKIGFIIAHKQGNVGGNYYNNRRYYYDTIKSLCEKWGIPYIDLWNGCYLNPANPAHYSTNELLFYTDGQHLSSAGYEYITPMIEAWMKTL